MKLIAHRANVYGPSFKENHPDQIIKAIRLDFDVEVDIRLINNKWYLGHDKPDYVVPETFLKDINGNAWFHCKNIEALKELDPSTYKFFWHQNDDFTLTSNGYIWTYPKKEITNKSIIVDLYLENKLNQNAYGICTDYPSLLEIL